MLITFHTDAYEDITYFADIAKRLLSLMGHSGTIPGAIKSEHLPEALERLQAGLKKEKKLPRMMKTTNRKSAWKNVLFL